MTIPNIIVLACEILFLVGFVVWVYTRNALQ
jgi:hypothetical protein